MRAWSMSHLAQPVGHLVISCGALGVRPRTPAESTVRGDGWLGRGDAVVALRNGSTFGAPAGCSAAEHSPTITSRVKAQTAALPGESRCVELMAGQTP